MGGYIYCLTNRAIPKLVKIGKTARDPMARAAEISAGTGVPTPFDVAWSMKVRDMDRAETDLHHALSKFRLQKKREFFRCSPGQARAAAKKLQGKGARQVRKRIASHDRMMGLGLTAGTAAIFAAAVTLDLDTATVATTTAALALGFCAIFQSLRLLNLLKS